jgi:hypothetical protein
VTEATSKIEYEKLMQPLFEEARRTGLWFHCSYQDLWFSPDELRSEHAKGSFRWGPSNWTLRDPKEMLVSAKKELERSAERFADLTERLRKGGVQL